MQALLFEMEPREGHEDHYFRHAAKLRPILMEHDGLIFIERFKSMARPDVILSHSLWRDEASIARWRTNKEHHNSQAAGRFKHFRDYRIRISHVLGHSKAGKPADSYSSTGAYTNPAATQNRLISIVRTSTPPETETGEVFESVTETSSFLTIDNVSNEHAGRAKLSHAENDQNVLSSLLAFTTRDYGLHDRDEAPQYFEDVPRDSLRK